MINTYPRETIEFQPISFELDGLPITNNVFVAVAATGTRPQTWAPATALDGAIGVMISGLAPGSWTVFAKVTDAPETPVVECGRIKIT